jgi:hypothetical protein
MTSIWQSEYRTAWLAPDELFLHELPIQPYWARTAPVGAIGSVKWRQAVALENPNETAECPEPSPKLARRSPWSAS